MAERNIVLELAQGVCPDAKARIFRAALEEFALMPFSAARTRAVAARAGVNHAAISYYFGGKKELYIEAVRQISEYIRLFMESFFERGEGVKRSKSSAAAKGLLSEFIMSRVCVDSPRDPLFKWIVMIITREEMYPTEAFDIIYDNVIKPSNDFMSRMIAIASRGACRGAEARIFAQMLVGQAMMFNSTRVGFKRLNGWRVFGEAEYKKIERVHGHVLGKLF